MAAPTLVSFSFRLILLLQIKRPSLVRVRKTGPKIDTFPQVHADTKEYEVEISDGGFGKILYFSFSSKNNSVVKFQLCGFQWLPLAAAPLVHCPRSARFAS